MPEESDIEVYRQRYETFRHLDRMRYQLLQILVAFCSAVGIFSRLQSTSLEWWFLLLVGAMFLLIGYAMSKVSCGLWKNNGVLSEIGKKIGDTKIPPLPKYKYRSASYWIYRIVQLLGVLFMLAGSICFIRLWY